MPFDNTIMGFTNVTSEHFDCARLYFKENPGYTHLSRKDIFWRRYPQLNVQNSFIYDRKQDLLYVKEDTHTDRRDWARRDLYGKYYTGTGAYGLFKQIQTERGERLGVKIARPLSSSTSAQEKAEAKASMIRSGVLLFDFEKESTTKKSFFTRNGNKLKEYTIQRLEQGRELFYEIERIQSTLERLKIALIVMEKVHMLHELGVIHCDLKEENIIYKKCKDDTYEIGLIDYGFARILPPEQAQVQGSRVRGTTGHIAPEITVKSLYSKASDIYALGAMFTGNREAWGTKNYNTHHWFQGRYRTKQWQAIWTQFDSMTAKKPEDRPSLPQVMAVVEAQLWSLGASSQRVPPFIMSSMRPVLGEHAPHKVQGSVPQPLKKEPALLAEPSTQKAQEVPMTDAVGSTQPMPVIMSTVVPPPKTAQAAEAKPVEMGGKLHYHKRKGKIRPCNKCQ